MNQLAYIVTSISIFFLLSLAFDMRLRSRRYSIDSFKIRKEIRLCLLTDFHCCRYGKAERVLIEEIHRGHPDVILLGGDIFDERFPWKNVEHLLSGLHNKYPMYYVSGNHEYRCGNIEKIYKILEKYQVNILDERWISLWVKDTELNLCGLSDPEFMADRDSEELTEEKLNALKKEGKKETYTILLTHRPELVRVYLNYEFDLILAGHAHGGQWRIPKLMNGFFAPGQGVFPKFAGGEYDFSDKKMIVSRGLARESTLVPRIFNRPEVVFIDLK